MNRKVEQTFASVMKAVGALTDHFSGADTFREDEESRAQARQQVRERILALRAGFTLIRDRQQQVIDNASRLRKQLRA